MIISLALVLLVTASSTLATYLYDEGPSFAAPEIHQIEQLLQFMTEHNLEEFEYSRGDLRIRLRKPSANVVMTAPRGGYVPEIIVAAGSGTGTASRSAARLRAMDRDPELPMAVLISGPGWAERNETGELAEAFGGRLYSDRNVDALVDEIEATVRTRGV